MKVSLALRLAPASAALLLALPLCADGGSAASAVAEGNRQYAGGKYDEAILNYQKALQELPESPEVFFNFFGIAPPNRATYRALRAASGHHHDKDAVRRRKLAIAGALGQGRLWLDWEYSDTLHRPETIERVAERCGQVVRELLALAQSR